MRVNISLFSKLCLLITNVILVFSVAILLFSNIFFIIGSSLSLYILLPVFASVILFAYWNIRNYFESHRQIILFGMIIFLGVVIGISIYGVSNFHEFSSDGQTSYSQARVELANGYNPFYDPTENEIIDQYPQAPWIYGTLVYLFTGILDSSRAFNIIFLVAGFCAAFSFFSSHRDNPLWITLLLSLLSVLNPVIICQSLSFLHDGQLGIMLLIIIFYSMSLLRKFDLPLLIGLGCALILATNIKLTGVVYGYLFSGGILAWFIITRQWIPINIISKMKGTKLLNGIKILIHSVDKNCRYWLMGLVFSLILGVVFFGYTSYVQNTIEDGSPFARLENIDEFLLKNRDLPPNWADYSPLRRFILSIFSESQNSAGEIAQLKIPFTFINREVLTFSSGANRVGGFGPLFSGVFLLTVILFPSAFSLAIRFKGMALDSLWVSLLISISVLITSAAWWNRFVPQFWLLPIFVVFTMLLYERRRIGRLLSYGLILALLLNASIVSYSYVTQARQATIELDIIFNTMKQASKKYPLNVYFKNRKIFPIYYSERKIRFEVVEKDELGCAEPVILPKLSNEVMYCVQ